MRGDIEVPDMPPVVTEHDESEQSAERRRRNGKEIQGDDVAQECEFRLDARPTPERVLAGHTLDQPLDHGFDLGSANLVGLPLPSPI